jgi:hypothetical protein
VRDLLAYAQGRSFTSSAQESRGSLAVRD